MRTLFQLEGPFLPPASCFFTHADYKAFTLFALSCCLTGTVLLFGQDSSLEVPCIPCYQTLFSFCTSGISTVIHMVRHAPAVECLADILYSMHGDKHLQWSAWQTSCKRCHEARV